MRVLVLTGGLGAGKSTASEFLRERGATIVDLDDVARHALGPDSSLLPMLAEEFGPEVLSEDGSLDRAALARFAFESPASAARLNALTHPVVAREVGPALADLRLLATQPRMVVLEVPLLAEAPVFAELADEVLAISAPVEVRIRRAVAKGMDEDDVRRRIAAQATDAEREALADIVISNDDGIEAFLGKLDAFWEQRFDGGGAPR
ncbi:MAG: dephospho-CoA kinase [Actinobacteria bacterium HGW-Actinobacteria-7]|jgi:dephospho-CoA kinase|nr:MAG: dephospho-CoA kinase [Actinobacteria bacterium HGW-Actinobacteria-7]